MEEGMDGWIEGLKEEGVGKGRKKVWKKLWMDGFKVGVLPRILEAGVPAMRASACSGVSFVLPINEATDLFLLCFSSTDSSEAFRCESITPFSVKAAGGTAFSSTLYMGSYASTKIGTPVTRSASEAAYSSGDEDRRDIEVQAC